MRPPAIAALALAALACGAANEYVEPPPPTVTVARPQTRSVVDYLEFTGTTQAINTVEIRARIEGFLQKVAFEEGAYVEQGALLFVIEPDEYAARLHRAEATLEVARTEKTLAETKLARVKQAFQTRAVSELEVIEAKAKADAAEARVASARAELEQARLDLSYTEIHAPIAGRVGRREVDPGNLVGASEQTLLTTIVQYDPIYAVFDMSERSLLEVVGRNRRSADGKARADRIPVELGRSNDQGYPFAGEIDYTDQQVDPATGTFLMRGIFPNPSPIQLLPGLFARLRVPVDRREGALLVSDRALGSDQSGSYLLVVDDQDVVQYRPVQVGTRVDDLRVIESGISADEWIVTDGLLRARPGSKVTPQRAGEPAAAPVAGG